MIISNSEVSAFQTCERKHYYAHREALKPRGGHSVALTRGIVGHDALEQYYKAKQKGLDAVHCVQDMLAVLHSSVRKYSEYEREIRQLEPVLIRYVEHYWDEPWKILEVESLHETPLLDNSTVTYGLRLDLLVEVTSGIEKGQIIVVDHKFVYDFFSDREKQMNTQLVKYIKTLRDNGINVRKGLLNQIRYRQLKSPKPEMLFRRDPVVASNAEIENFWEEFKKPVYRMLELTGASKECHARTSEMHIDKQTCGSCAFQPLCKLTLQGLGTQKTKELLYDHNDYVDNYTR